MKLESFFSYAFAFGLVTASASAQLVSEYQLHKATISLSIQYESDVVTKPGKDGGSSLTQSIVTEKLSNVEIMEGLLEDESTSAAMGGTVKGWSIVAITQDGEFTGFALNNKAGVFIDISEFITLLIRDEGSNFMFGDLQLVDSFKTTRGVLTEDTSGSFLTAARLDILGEDLILRANGITSVTYTYKDTDYTDEVDGKLVTSGVSCRTMVGSALDASIGGLGYCFVSGSFSLAKGAVINQPTFVPN